MLVSRAIIFRFPHGEGDIEIGKPAFSRPFANQHAEAVFGIGLNNLALYLSVDDMTFQTEIELAAGGDAQAATDFHRNDDLAFIGNGDGWHGSSFILHGKNILARDITPATERGLDADLPGANDSGASGSSSCLPPPEGGRFALMAFWAKMLREAFSRSAASSILRVTFARAAAASSNWPKSNSTERLYAKQGINTQELLGHKDPKTTQTNHDSRGDWVRVKVG
jgi:hypothetical protein